MDTVTLDVVTSNVGEGAITGAVGDTLTLTFTTGLWDTAQTVTVTGVDEDIDDNNQAYTITLSAASSTGDPRYDMMNPSITSFAMTNVDDDVAAVTVSTISTTTTRLVGCFDAGCGLLVWLVGVAC